MEEAEKEEAIREEETEGEGTAVESEEEMVAEEGSTGAADSVEAKEEEETVAAGGEEEADMAMVAEMVAILAAMAKASTEACAEGSPVE